MANGSNKPQYDTETLIVILKLSTQSEVSKNTICHTEALAEVSQTHKIEIFRFL